jgi:hypothetical protein
MLYELLVIGSIYLSLRFFCHSKKTDSRLPGLFYDGQAPGAFDLAEVGTL